MNGKDSTQSENEGPITIDISRLAKFLGILTTHSHSSQSRVGTKYKISGSSKILGAGPVPGVDQGVQRLKAGAPKQTTALVPEVLQPL